MTEKIRRLEIIGGLSRGLNLVGGHDSYHNLRVAAMAVQITRAYERTHAVPTAERLAVLHGALLKDSGCSKNARGMSEFLGVNDQQAKYDAQFVNPTSWWQRARYLFAHTLPERRFDCHRRWQEFLSRARTADEVAKELMHLRCFRGGLIARQLGFSDEVVRAINEYLECWNGGGQPRGLKGETISLAARIIRCAHVADVFYTRADREGRPQRNRRAALQAVRSWSGSVLDPAVVRAFFEAQESAYFWEILQEDATILAHVGALEEQIEQPVLVTPVELVPIADGFGLFINAKSSYTGNHSRRVGVYARSVARRVKPGDEDFARLAYIAGELHDLGKVGISDQVLYKPGPLDDDEWDHMKRHPGWGFSILSPIPALRETAAVALTHHRGFKCGYPDLPDGFSISVLSRIISVVDAFDAQIADRPYREGMPFEQVLRNLMEDSGIVPRPAERAGKPLQFDKDIVHLIPECVGEWESEIRESREATESA